MLDEPYYLYRQIQDGSNVNARPKHWDHFFQRLCTRNPQVFKKHYPHISEENMATEMLSRHRTSPYGSFIKAVENPKGALIELIKGTAKTILPDAFQKAIKKQRSNNKELPFYSPT